MSDMVPTGSKYTDTERKEAAVQYAITGLLTRVSSDTGIPETTLSDWTKTEWWDDVIGEVRSEKQNEHIALYHALTTKALDKANTGIDKLDDDLSASDIKALVITGAAATDKARLLLNQPTTISGKSDSIKEMTALFRKASRENKLFNESVVSTQHKAKTTT